MSQIESEILMRVSHLDGDKKSAVLDYIRNLDGGQHSNKRRRRRALRQIRKALSGQD